MKKAFKLLGIVLLLTYACKKPTEEATGPRLIFKFKFDSTQVRLNNFGNPTGMKDGNWGQSPVFHSMSAHYIELAPDSLTFFGQGDVIYQAAEVGTSPNNAIDFSKSRFAGNGEEFYSLPIKNVTPGTYKWLRVSLAYQNYDIKIWYKNAAIPLANGMYDGRVASFVGFNTYLTSYKIKDKTVIVNDKKKQGYGALELFNLPSFFPNIAPKEWQAPAGATTVPNPIFNSSPIPQGSCVVTGRIESSNFTITGNETKDIIITVSLSTNKSFEWKDKNGDHLYQPINELDPTLVEDSVVDMGLRGMRVLIEN